MITISQIHANKTDDGVDILLIAFDGLPTTKVRNHWHQNAWIELVSFKQNYF